VRIEVRDTGIGLSPEAQSRLFEKFVQADVSTTRRFGGTGLGLAICKQIVELMGGKIGVDSEEGVGSTFWIELDFDRLQKGVNQPAAAAPGTHVLLAYKHDESREIIARQLQAFGLEVTSVTEVGGLVDNATGTGTAPFDAVLIDQDIDGASGAIACAKYAQAQPDADTQVVLFINRGLAGEAAKRANPDIKNFVAKPARPSRLLAAIDPHGHAENADGEKTCAPGEVSASRPSGLDILLAEDNLVNQQVAIAMLSKGGHRIDIANDGIEALMMASKKQYDVILMDVQMPNMSGIDATKKIRRLQGPVAETSIVAMTANAMVGDRETYLEAGMDDYVSKPIDPNHLSAVLTRQSGRNSVAGALADSGGGVAETTDISKEDVEDVLDALDSLFEDDDS